jgi:hypothetical protein
MREREQRIPATEKETMPRTIEASQPAGGTDKLLSQLRDLRTGRLPEGLTLAQRAALERIEAALDVYRSVFYPPGPLYGTPLLGRVDDRTIYAQDTYGPDVVKE